MKIRTRMFCLSAALMIAASPVMAQELPVEGPVPTTALIGVDSKNGDQLNPAMLKLQVNGHDTPITSVTPVSAAQAAQIAILIDDGLRGSFSLQLNDLAKFINGLPPHAEVLVGYMQNGVVRSATGDFSNNHEEIVSKLRIPMSAAGISASPYFCLSDFVKHWPSEKQVPRFVLMVTNGVDPYNGSPSILNQNSPYVQAAQEDAQRAGVAVYSIYFPDSGLRRARGSFSGQSYLQQVGEATGGVSFNQGPIPPVTITPYLEQFQRAIAESYTVAFMAEPKGKNPTAFIKLKTSQPGIKLRAPDSVRPGLVEQNNVAVR
jgi:hypothetical protein